MSDAVALCPPRTLPLGLVLILIPLALAIAGLAIRYLAYAATVPDASIASFAQGMCRWDCSWYVKLSQTGYDPFPVPTMINAGNWAFFPLYPILVAIVRHIAGTAGRERKQETYGFGRIVGLRVHARARHDPRQHEQFFQPHGYLLT